MERLVSKVEVVTHERHSIGDGFISSRTDRHGSICAAVIVPGGLRTLRWMTNTAPSMSAYTYSERKILLPDIVFQLQLLNERRPRMRPLFLRGDGSVYAGCLPNTNYNNFSCSNYYSNILKRNSAAVVANESINHFFSSGFNDHCREACSYYGHMYESCYSFLRPPTEIETPEKWESIGREFPDYWASDKPWKQLTKLCDSILDMRELSSDLVKNSRRHPIKETR